MKIFVRLHAHVEIVYGYAEECFLCPFILPNEKKNIAKVISIFLTYMENELKVKSYIPLLE